MVLKNSPLIPLRILIYLLKILLNIISNYGDPCLRLGQNKLTVK